MLVVDFFEFVDEVEIKVKIGVGVGLLGVVNFNIFVIIDCIVVLMFDFSCGVNIDGKYYFNVNWEWDVVMLEVFDLCNVVEGDLSLDGKGMF